MAGRMWLLRRCTTSSHCVIKKLEPAGYTWDDCQELTMGWSKAVYPRQVTPGGPLLLPDVWLSLTLQTFAVTFAQHHPNLATHPQTYASK